MSTPNDSVETDDPPVELGRVKLQVKPIGRGQPYFYLSRKLTDQLGWHKGDQLELIGRRNHPQGLLLRKADKPAETLNPPKAKVRRKHDGKVQCSSCHRRSPLDASYCTNCGKALEKRVGT